MTRADETTSTEDGSVHLRYDQQPLPYHQAVAATVARYLPPNGRVVDIGCGVGHALALLTAARPDARAAAVDVDPRCLAITASRVPGLETMPVDLEGLLDVDLAWTPDVLMMSHVLEHTRRPADLVLHLAAQLPPSGVLVLAVPNPVRPAVMVSSALRRDYVNRGHLYAWDRAHWMNFLERVLELDVLEYGVDYLPIVPERVRRRWPRLIGGAERQAVRALPWWSFSNLAVVRGTGPAEPLPVR